MYPQTQTTTSTAWPIFAQARLTKSPKGEATETLTEAATEAEATEVASISISEKDYQKIAAYITNHCQEDEDNYFVCNLDDVDFDLECGCVVELTGDITIRNDYSEREYAATGYTGQAVEIFAGIDCKAYNRDGDLTTSDFRQKHLETYIF